MEHLFGKVTPAGPTPLGDCLERVSGRLLKDISKGNPCKKVNYLVITDGRPSELCVTVDAKTLLTGDDQPTMPRVLSCTSPSG